MNITGWLDRMRDNGQAIVLIKVMRRKRYFHPWLPHLSRMINEGLRLGKANGGVIIKVTKPKG